MNKKKIRKAEIAPKLHKMMDMTSTDILTEPSEVVDNKMETEAIALSKEL